MATADDGREPAPRDERPTTNDPDEITRRGAGGRRLVALVAGIALVVVLAVWLVIYLSARETSDDSMGAAAADAAASVVQ